MVLLVLFEATSVIICPKAFLKIRPIWTKTGPKCSQIPYFAASERYLKSVLSILAIWGLVRLFRETH